MSSELRVGVRPRSKSGRFTGHHDQWIMKFTGHNCVCLSLFCFPHLIILKKMLTFLVRIPRKTCVCRCAVNDNICQAEKFICQ